jgi:formylglycine-generating enzyme required for sulfatase activity/serine/threonine protein kinase
MKRCPFCDEEIRDNAIKCKHCGSMLDGTDALSVHDQPGPTDTLSAGRTILAEELRPGKILAGQYRIIGEGPLGSGGMGEVWKAEDTELGVTVAIKVLPAQLARDETAMANLRREALIGRQLTHSHICRLYGFHSDGRLKFIVMEYVEGKTLRQLLNERPEGKYTWEELEPIARQLGGALDYAHTVTYRSPDGRTVQGILHRDIKPQNIMVTADGQAKLMDFGIAREIHNSMTQVTGRTSQTPMYASPEQFRGERMTAASDIYSFTAVLYECLAGHPLVSPHGDLSWQILHREWEPLGDQSEAVNAMLRAGLARKGSERPETTPGLLRLLSNPASVAEPDRLRAQPVDPKGPFLPKVPAPLPASQGVDEPEPVPEPPPRPEIVSVKYPKKIQIGEWADVEVTVRNTGGPSHFGGLSVSFPSLTASSDADCVENCSDRMGFDLYRPGQEIWHRKSGHTPASCLLAEWSGEFPGDGAECQFSFRVGSMRPGPLHMFVRSALSQDVQAYFGAPADGPEDQQGWPALEETIVVSASGATPPAPSESRAPTRPPEEPVRRWPDTHRGPRPQSGPEPSRHWPAWLWGLGALVALVLLIAGAAWVQNNTSRREAAHRGIQRIPPRQPKVIEPTVPRNRDLTPGRDEQRPGTSAAPAPAKTLTLDCGRGVRLELVQIPAGTFLMGSPSSESGCDDDETQHRVTITRPFYMGIHEVTQEQYEAMMGNNPSNFKGAKNPVEQVSHDDAVAFCRKLSQPTGKTVRLPTEAEWEYACRAGTTSRFSFGDSDSSLSDHAWYSGNSGRQTHSVGGRKPNAWGLYDMHGNVWEWCSDWYGEYPSGNSIDPKGPNNGSIRVLRGGSWGHDPQDCRSAGRSRGAPGGAVNDDGFRVVVSLD